MKITDTMSEATIIEELGRSSIQLDKLVRILRALRLSDNLDALAPELGVRPLQLVQSKSGLRHRARARKSSSPAKGQGWVWGDKK
jgi:hypothetical protein